MSDAKAKTINLLLFEGDLDGVISIEDSSWNSGELYSAPRDSVDELLQTDAVKKYGVYLLLSKDMVYVGQASDLARRITQHKVGKDWWESVVILTTKDDSLSHTSIDYLESVLIEKAQKINKLDCENKNKGNNPKVSKFEKVVLDQYLDEALFLMQLIGITAFTDTKSNKSTSSNNTLISTVDTHTKLTVGKRAKNEAIKFLSSNGISVNEYTSYAARQNGTGDYWINPKKDLTTVDWTIILNNNVDTELMVLRIPAGSMKTGDAKSGELRYRTDRPDLLDLNLNCKSLIDARSKIDFSKYILSKVKY